MWESFQCVRAHSLWIWVIVNCVKDIVFVHLSQWKWKEVKPACNRHGQISKFVCLSFELIAIKNNNQKYSNNNNSTAYNNNKRSMMNDDCAFCNIEFYSLRCTWFWDLEKKKKTEIMSSIVNSFFMHFLCSFYSKIFTFSSANDKNQTKNLTTNSRNEKHNVI